MQNHDVASTILQQLGGHRFVAMTGARHFLTSEYGLSFKLPDRFAMDKINKVYIKLMPSDTYRVMFIHQGRAPNFKITIVKEYDDIYAENLQSTFTSTTGLDTHL